MQVSLPARPANREDDAMTAVQAVAASGPLQAIPLSEVAGAEISGVDLSQPIGDDLRAQILDAFLAHHLLVFRGQSLSPAQQAAFSENFGALEEHVIRLPDGNKPPLVHVVSNLDADGNPTERPHSHGNYFWHTDKSYHAVPSLMTLLHAIELPPGGGGDTQFANMRRAYEALPEPLRRRIAPLRAEHSWEASRRNTGNRPASEEEMRERPPVTHPIVRTHPDSGRKSLYIGIHSSHVEGLPRDEGAALLDELLQHATQPQFVYTHRWRAGDLVMWDNRCLLHRALANYPMGTQRRLLHRTVVRGSVPH
jgi:taurine dioxygenase